MIDLGYEGDWGGKIPTIVRWFPHSLKGRTLFKHILLSCDECDFEYITLIDNG